MFEAHKITGPLPSVLRLVANGAGIPSFTTYLQAVRLAKEHAHLLSPIWARPGIIALSKRLLGTAYLAATYTPGRGDTVRRHHRPTLRLVKG